MSNHWYTKDGDALFEVPKKTGDGMRKTTIRDARELGLVPSVTTVLSIINKPALNTWFVRQALEACTRNPMGPDEDEKRYIHRVMDISTKERDSVAKDGTTIHKHIEHYLSGNGYKNDDMRIRKIVDAVLTTLKLYGIDQYNSAPEVSFASTNGYGGTIDLFSEKIIFDFKTKDFDEETNTRTLAYPEMAMQLAAYKHGVSKPKARMINVFISRSNPGLVYCHEWENDNWYGMFTTLLSFWNMYNNFNEVEI